MPERTLIELLYGKGAHANPVACIEDLPAELAGRHAEDLPHSVWQIVWHVNFWTDYELRRIRGEKPRYPDHAAESWPPGAPPSEAEWKKEAARFAELIGILAAMAEGDSNELSCEVPAMHPNQEKHSSTALAILWQILAHNSYHVGQIVLVRCALGVWPPLGGGDSW
ncbi:MAG TPA: DinB family protein [Candidatus Acidoferrum sp.]|nr:DinB family protein [Candidatus Acidoferrum sp.]